MICFIQGVNFPAFYSPDSGFKSPLNVANPMQAARVMKSNLELNLGSGIHRKIDG